MFAHRYKHESPEWPNYHVGCEEVAPFLVAAHRRHAALLVRLDPLGIETRDAIGLEALAEEVAKSSEIEGEELSFRSIRTSIAYRLNPSLPRHVPVDRQVEGPVEIVLDATQDYGRKLDSGRLFAWHRALFPIGRSGLYPIKVGDWRDDRQGPMQVVSGPRGGEAVHFQAPDAERVPEEMASSGGSSLTTGWTVLCAPLWLTLGL